MGCFSYEMPVMKAVDLDTKKVYLYFVRCKKWDCPFCGGQNKLQWVAKISGGIDHYLDNGVIDWKFVTLTMHPNNKTLDQCLYVWPKAWKKLSTRIKRKYGAVKYVIIPELHKKGRLHVHALMSGGMSKRWCKDNAPACGLGYMVDVSPMGSGYNSVLYVSKELHKGLQIHKWPPHLRRIRTSQKWPVIAPSADFNDVKLAWRYLCQYPLESAVYLREQIQYITGMETIVINERMGAPGA